MNTTTHAISYAGRQDGIAFRVENAILVLAYLRTFDRSVRNAQTCERYAAAAKTPRAREVFLASAKMWRSK